MAKIQKRDFFKATKSQEAIPSLQNCLERLQIYTHQVYSEEGIDLTPAADHSLEDKQFSDQETKEVEQRAQAGATLMGHGGTAALLPSGCIGDRLDPG